MRLSRVVKSSLSGVKVTFNLQTSSITMEFLLLVFFSLLTGFEVTFGDENGAATKPYVTSLKQTENWALLQCQVRGASPKPELHWQDGDGNILHAEEPKVTERRGRYDVILNITVTKTDNYRCVATQEKISHQIYVYIHSGKDHDRTPENPVSGSCTGWIVAVAVLGVVVFLGVAGCCIKCCR